MAKLVPGSEEDRERFLAQLVKVARPIMLSVVQRDSCIAMTRCAIEIAQAFGYYNVKPMQAECIIVNKEFCALHDAGRIKMDEALPDWAVEEGAWAIGLGVSPKPQEAGHLVAIMDDRFLIDLSIDQATRRLKGIVLLPFVLEITEPIPQLITNGGVLVSYRLQPNWNHYSDSPDWKRYRQRYWNATAKIIRKMRWNLR